MGLKSLGRVVAISVQKKILIIVFARQSKQASTKKHRGKYISLIVTSSPPRRSTGATRCSVDRAFAFLCSSLLCFHRCSLRHTRAPAPRAHTLHGHDWLVLIDTPFLHRYRCLSLEQRGHGVLFWALVFCLVLEEGGFFLLFVLLIAGVEDVGRGGAFPPSLFFCFFASGKLWAWE